MKPSAPGDALATPFSGILPSREMIGLSGCPSARQEFHQHKQLWGFLQKELGKIGTEYLLELLDSKPGASSTLAVPINRKFCLHSLDRFVF